MARKSGLGRGLGALLGETAGEVGIAADVAPRELPIDQVLPNPNQPRKAFDENELEELADSIRRNGILQPLVVRKQNDDYQIVAGERRYKAAQRANLMSVPVVVREVSDQEVLLLAMIENLQRTDLNPLEEARGYRDLIDKNGLTQDELGKVLSKSRSTIANTLRLLELPDEVQDMVYNGQLTAGHARAILSVKGEQNRVALARKIVADGLSVRQTEILGPLFSVKNEESSTRRQAAPQSYKQAARQLRNKLATKVSVRSVRGRNKIEIEFGDEDELSSLVQKILGE